MREISQCHESCDEGPVDPALLAQARLGRAVPAGQVVPDRLDLADPAVPADRVVLAARVDQVAPARGAD